MDALVEFSSLIKSISWDDRTGTVTIPANWLQGRTTYGGLTAALCHEAARPFGGDKPLRAMQISFIGPVGGEVTLTPTLLREGKNTAFVNVRVTYEGGIGADAIFTFGKARDSILDFERLPMPEIAGPDETDSYLGGTPLRPPFTRNFNMRLALGGRPFSGDQTGEIGLWLRHKDEASAFDNTTLLALGDAPPPAAFAMLTTPTLVSSMTWMTEFLTETPTTENGWVFAHHYAELTRGGYSSQRMTVWNTKGEPLLIGRQSVAVFG